MGQCVSRVGHNNINHSSDGDYDPTADNVSDEARDMMEQEYEDDFDDYEEDFEEGSSSESDDVIDEDDDINNNDEGVEMDRVPAYRYGQINSPSRHFMLFEF